MRLWFDITRWFSDWLKGKGYVDVPWPPARRIPAQVLDGARGTVVVVRPGIRLDPQAGNVDQQVGDYFGRLRKMLEGLKSKRPVRHLVFQGGGTVPIPDRFRDWCESQGIRIHIIDPENPSALDEALGVFT